MANTYSSTQRLARHAARLRWLKKWSKTVELPGASQDVEDFQREALLQAHEAMVKAGLYSPTSEPRACRWGIRLLVSELRGEYVADAQQRYRT
jgi:hypothetical protein